MDIEPQITLSNRMFWTIADKVEFILHVLNEKIPNPQPSLIHESGFQLLIATLLSGQSSDKTVNGVTPYLFQKAPNAPRMSLLSEQEISAIIKPCGLFRKKAACILQIARYLDSIQEPDIPNDRESLMKLPGVGRKTALVVLSQWFQIQGFPVDTHIMRLARRWKLSTQNSPEKIEQDLIKIFEKQNFIKLHLQLIYYGRAFCPAKKHNPEKCVICHKIHMFE